MSDSMIASDAELKEFVDRLSGAARIAFDTEFVSEHTYRPQLCLVQVAVDGALTAIDVVSVRDLKSFWEVLAAPEHETIVHAGREELLFCLDAVGSPPAELFDIQIAAGLVGLEYPASYGTLVYKVLGVTPDKGETRTDWRRRPLTHRQIDYALADVKHLEPLRDELHARLEKLGRIDWFRHEMNRWQGDVTDWSTRERWRRVSGSGNLNRRRLAIVRELWRWREAEAKSRDCPPRRVLRDDLIVELAKRGATDSKHIGAVRGFERGDLKRALPALAQCIQQALDLPDKDCPATIRGDKSPQQGMLGQFLLSALTTISRREKLAPNIVGTASDVRDLISYRLDGPSSNQAEPPLLAQGWRAEVIGQILDDLLTGKVAIRIANARSADPLSFER